LINDRFMCVGSPTSFSKEFSDGSVCQKDEATVKIQISADARMPSYFSFPFICMTVCHSSKTDDGLTEKRRFPRSISCGCNTRSRRPASSSMRDKSHDVAMLPVF
jgi:hypothetical protein